MTLANTCALSSSAPPSNVPETLSLPYPVPKDLCRPSSAGSDIVRGLPHRDSTVAIFWWWINPKHATASMLLWHASSPAAGPWWWLRWCNKLKLPCIRGKGWALQCAIYESLACRPAKDPVRLALQIQNCLCALNQLSEWGKNEPYHPEHWQLTATLSSHSLRFSLWEHDILCNLCSVSRVFAKREYLWQLMKLQLLSALMVFVEVSRLSRWEDYWIHMQK